MLAHFEANQVDLLLWLPRSHDLSPREEVWEIMGRILLRLLHPSQTLPVLGHEVQVA